MEYTLCRRSLPGVAAAYDTLAIRRVDSHTLGSIFLACLSGACILLDPKFTDIRNRGYLHLHGHKSLEERLVTLKRKAVDFG
jgi:hypothetical protein